MSPLGVRPHLQPDPDASLSKLIFDRAPSSQPASDEKLKRSGQPNMFEPDGLRMRRDEVRGSQEQIQIIATAIGRPMMKAPAMAKVNANSGFASGRTLPDDMSLTPGIDPEAATGTKR